MELALLFAIRSLLVTLFKGKISQICKTLVCSLSKRSLVMNSESQVNRMERIGTLSEEALKRRERLKSLQKQRTDDEQNGINGTIETDSDPLPCPIFRSYQPMDESLKEKVLPKAKPVSVEEKMKNHLEATIPDSVLNEVSLTSLAPRKLDWDLKRDVEKKLDLLERRTQKAIVELIKERLLSYTGENGSIDAVNLAEVVNCIDTQNADSDND